MTHDELKAESQRLLTLSDSWVNADRSGGSGHGAQLLAHALEGCFALVFAGIPAWIASMVLDQPQATLAVFCAMIVFYGCVGIASAISGQAVAHAKVVDTLNALRIALIDLANRVEHGATSSKR